MNDEQQFVLPENEQIHTARSKLIRTLPDKGKGDAEIRRHLADDLLPGLSRSSQSANYYGFVTGGSTDIASYADNVVTQCDQNVQVHLPNETIATDIEDAALRQLCDFIDFSAEEWPHRTFTTGATASNILGLACGREYVISTLARKQDKNASVSETGILEAMRAADIDRIQILTTLPHSSLGKAASILGLGRSSIIDLGLFQAKHNFDFAALENALKRPRTASIIVISCGEVNTGYFATSDSDMQTIRALSDAHSAWIHVDAAFGLPARLLPASSPYYRALVSGVRDIHLADSITGDAHKLLNVPYDCGIFLSRHLDIATTVFQNSNAAYLSSSASSSDSIPSPLNIGIENSRRFRALPVYASLSSLGREGYTELLERQIRLARLIAEFIQSRPEFELLPRYPPSFGKVKEQGISRVYIIVLFRAVDDGVNEQLVKKVNATRRIYISGTQWEGAPAARFAVSNWQVDVERDLGLVKEVLLGVVASTAGSN
jgi:glutamate/tyrosine decarboxylase-like PLP-dependent enzyme